MSKIESKHVKIGQLNIKRLKNCHNRIYVVIIVMLFIFCIVSYKLFDVSISSDSYIVDIDDEDSKQISSDRREIVDRNDTLLAINLKTASLYANPQKIINLDEAVIKLKAIFPNLDEEKLFKRLGSRRHFVWIKRNLTPIEQKKINDIGLPGLYYQSEEKRIYPHKNLFSHIVGYLDIDGKAISGVEKYYDNILTNSDTEFLQLSLDLRVQDIVRSKLAQGMKEFKAKSATAIVTNVNNGEILAMVNLPDFNPNIIQKSTAEQRFNSATFGVYEMGSTFKIFNMALGFEHSNLKMKDEYDISEPIKVDKFLIRDFHQKKDVLSAAEIFIHSSNIGSAKIANNIGSKLQKQFLGQIGLFDDLKIEIPEKSSPLLPKTWSDVSAMTISYGHGIAVTPMHLVRSTAALINGGMLYPLTIIKGKNDKYQPSRVVDKKTSDNIRKLMRFAVKYGTGAKANNNNYFVGGKTGSADKVNKGGYNSNAILSSFISAFPMNDPKYLVFVMFDEPVGNKSTGYYATGGQVAAPIANNIIRTIGPILKVRAVDEDNYKIRSEFWYDNYDEQEQNIAHN